VSKKTDDLIETFKNMTLGELSDFRTRFEETFDVSSDLVLPDALNSTEPPDDDEMLLCDLILESAGQKKIQVIKVVRQLGLGLSLKEAKDLVDRAPSRLLAKVAKAAADEAAKALAEVGATVRYQT
jgi:large subunit ribosomal protein L7/L12